MGYVCVKPVAWEWKKEETGNRKRKQKKKTRKEKFCESKIKSLVHSNPVRHTYTNEVRTGGSSKYFVYNIYNQTCNLYALCFKMV